MTFRKVLPSQDKGCKFRSLQGPAGSANEDGPRGQKNNYTTLGLAFVSLLLTYMWTQSLSLLKEEQQWECSSTWPLPGLTEGAGQSRGPYWASNGDLEGVWAWGSDPLTAKRI